MKRIFGIMAILLIWAGAVDAGVLKVMVPVDEFEQMESRLEELKKENRQLKKGSNSLPDKTTEVDRTAYTNEMQSRIEALERENNQLKQEANQPLPANSLEAERAANAAEELEAQLKELEQENKHLKQEVWSLAEKSSEETTSSESSKKLETRLDALGRENRRLKRSVASLKDTGAVLRSDKRTAGHVYSERNKIFSSHIYK
ncbi:MAG: hypothetical protein ABFS18_05455 [Thermodesulfobacteriota bacterium]